MARVQSGDEHTSNINIPGPCNYSVTSFLVHIDHSHSAVFVLRTIILPNWSLLGGGIEMQTNKIGDINLIEHSLLVSASWPFRWLQFGSLAIALNNAVMCCHPFPLYYMEYFNKSHLKFRRDDNCLQSSTKFKINSSSSAGPSNSSPAPLGKDRLSKRCVSPDLLPLGIRLEGGRLKCPGMQTMFIHLWNTSCCP